MLFTGSLLISVLGILLILKRPQLLGVDSPDGYRKQHTKPISRLGGLPIFIALCSGFVVLAIRRPDFLGEWTPVIIGNVIVFGVGFLDDLHPLGARVKLLGQIGAALILYSLGLSIDNLSNPLGDGTMSLGWWSLPVTVLWLIAIPNIVNLIDGMDGLASGFGMFLCLTLAFIGHYTLKPDISLVSTVMGGALAGFLIFNFPPAKIFLGDGGAYLIGFFVASVSLMSSNKGSIMASLLVVLIALGVPILDTAFAILRRAIRGVPIFRADAEHIHHRLITLGYSKGQALVGLYAVCLVLSLAGISILMTKGLAFPVVAALCFLLAVGAARYLGYIRSWANLRNQFREALQRRRVREYIRCHGTLLEMEVERCKTADEFVRLLEHSIGRLRLSKSPGPATEPVAIGSSGNKRLLLYQPAARDESDEWVERVHALDLAVMRAFEKWVDLPGFHCISRSSPLPDHQPISDHVS
ncbi:MAG: undecaprenyl/decaprenyl-phosphate alpha-N-acetylglucosaminyl 1-phosphate transferase [Verrucomicrobiales bacterium]|nr:undecaprenyl/decaprenyl-phosphate alpha-N-acetylglucosaminyl 1-phosphate transferase [Verrucomicrobiales bacterium]